MARIVACTISTPGHCFPFVPILQELRRRRHDVRIALPASAGAAGDIRGIPVTHLEIRIPGSDAILRPLNRRTRSAVTQRSYVAHGEPVAAALEAEMSRLNPDFLLVDPILWGAMVAAEASGVPWASVSHNPFTLRGMGFDVRGPGLRPAHSPLGKLWHRIVAIPAFAENQRFLPIVNDVRGQRGLSALRYVWDLYRRPPLVIATTTEPFEYPRDDWPAAVRFVGPMSSDAASSARQEPAPSPSRPRILLAGSSILEQGKAASWVNLAIDALAEEPVEILATVPTGPLPERVPANVRVVRFASHAEVLPGTSCVVCHGGPGITQKALAAGVPVVAVPFAYDRFEVARRVEVAAAGVMLPGKRLTRARLKRAVYTALERKEGALRVAAAFRQAGGAPAAADAVESALGISHRSGDVGDVSLALEKASAAE